MNFGEAIEAAKNGKRIYRKGWNGKGQYVELAKNLSYTGTDGAVVNAKHDAIGNKALAFVGTSGVQIGWLASQADMLAEDWMILDCNNFTLDFCNSDTGYIKFGGKRYKAKLLDIKSVSLFWTEDQTKEITFVFWADDISKS